MLTSPQISYNEESSTKTNVFTKKQILGNYIINILKKMKILNKTKFIKDYYKIRLHMLENR